MTEIVQAQSRSFRNLMTWRLGSPWNKPGYFGEYKKPHSTAGILTIISQTSSLYSCHYID